VGKHKALSGPGCIPTYRFVKFCGIRERGNGGGGRDHNWINAETSRVL